MRVLRLFALVGFCTSLLSTVPLAGACKPVVITAGCFLNDSADVWSTAGETQTAPDGTRTVEIKGATITITLNGKSFVDTRSSPGWKYRFIGEDKHLLVLRADSTMATPFQVYVVDFTSGTPKLTAIQGSASTPKVHPSPGNGAAFFLIYDNFGSNNSSIYRSDTGAFLCLGPFGMGSLLAASFDGEILHTHLSSCSNAPFSSCPLHTTSFPSAGFPKTAVVGLDELVATASIINTGADCVEIADIPAVPPFRVTNSLPITIDPGLSHLVTIEFAPTAAGSFPRTLTVKGNDGRTLSTISVSGTARNAVPDIKLTADSGFGGLLTDALPEEVRFSVANAGEGAVKIDTIALETPEDPHFEVVATSGFTVPPTNHFTVRFTPGSTPGTFTNKVIVKGASTISPAPPGANVTASMGFSATTIERQPNVLCVDDGHDFGELAVGEFHELPVYYRNSGTKDLVLLASPTIKEEGGNHVFDFKSAPSTEPLPADAYRSELILFYADPRVGVGSYTGQFTISSNDPDEPMKTCTFHVTATGLPPGPRPPLCDDPILPCVPALSEFGLLLLIVTLGCLGAGAISRRW